jgi:hypothetical protein
MVWGELFVAERNALPQGDGLDLIVADGEPGVPAADQNAVDPGGMHEGDDGRVSHTANAPVFQIEHRHTDQLREKQKVVRHRIRAPPRSAIPNMAHPRAIPQAKIAELSNPVELALPHHE